LIKNFLGNKRRFNIRIFAGFLGILFVLIWLLGVELYLRRTQTRILPYSNKNIYLASSPNFLIDFTPNGRRLLPDIHAIILHHNVSGQNIDFRTNRFRCRGPELKSPKPLNTQRILFLGDSITMADTVQEEETFITLIQKNIGQIFKTENIELLNAGVGDTGTKEQLDILEETGLSAEPDIVVLDYYLNDTRPPQGFSQERGRSGWLRRHSLLTDKLYNLFVFRGWLKEQGQDRWLWGNKMSQYSWDTDPSVFKRFAKEAQFDWGAAWEPEALEIADGNFKRLSLLSRKYHFKVLVVNFPVMFQVYSHFVNDEPQQMIKQLSEKYGFKFLDLLPTLRLNNNKRLFFDWCHPLVPTHSIIAETLSPILEDMIKENRT